jgi:hypothetical protein
VTKELPYDLSHLLYGVNVESKMAHMIMEDQNYISWKTSDPECPNFSQYVVQIKTLVDFWNSGEQSTSQLFILLTSSGTHKHLDGILAGSLEPVSAGLF